MGDVGIEVQARTKKFVMEMGRPVDQARYRLHFEGGAGTAVVDALSAYQNVDGGFGHGLEADIRTAASSPIATSLGLELLHEVGATVETPQVEAAVVYLVNAIDSERWVWEMVPPAVEDAPHAPWWTYVDTPKFFNGFVINPRAALVTHLHRYAELVPDEVLVPVTESLLASLTATAVEAWSMHDLLAAQGLLNSPLLSPTTLSYLRPILTQVAQHLVVSDPAQWEGYVLLPLDVAFAPEAPLTKALPRSGIEAHLNHLVGSQLESGAWPIPWQWGDDPALWAQVEREWQSHHSITNLKTLHAWGKLA